MKRASQVFSFLAVLFVLVGCGSQEAPKDANGKPPEQVMMQTYQFILAGKFDEAEANFSAEFIEEFITSKNTTFIDYNTNTKGWKPEWLKTKLMGNDYNDNVWRVKIIPDEGKGNENGPGIVQDLHLIDGVWKIVFWNHYPKS